MALFTSCNEDNPTNKSTGTEILNCRAVDLDEGTVVFSQNSVNYEIDFNDMTIKFTGKYRDIDNQTLSFTTPAMKMTDEGNTVCSFTNGKIGPENINGYIDLYGTGMTWLTFMDGSTNVVCSFQLLYAYCQTTVTNSDNSSNFIHEESAYFFSLDSRGETCTMQISNFIPNTNGTTQASMLQYKDLTVTPTTTGYNITADKVESNYKDFYTITDLNISLTSDCHIIGGTFKCDHHNFSISGKMFPNIGGPYDL